MREIKFRGRADALITYEWCYGAYVPESSVNRAKIIVTDDLRRFEYEMLVDPATVGQFTGLCDCEGKEIYEGDVVRHENYICLVVYNSTRFASFALRKDGWAFDHYFGEAFEASECQVIGNIHDSPELLEERR